MSTPNDANAIADAAPDYDEQCRKATTDLSSMNRVSHRLALVDTTDRLQAVLDKLLPLVNSHLTISGIGINKVCSVSRRCGLYILGACV